MNIINGPFFILFLGSTLLKKKGPWKLMNFHPVEYLPKIKKRQRRILQEARITQNQKNCGLFDDCFHFLRDQDLDHSKLLNLKKKSYIPWQNVIALILFISSMILCTTVYVLVTTYIINKIPRNIHLCLVHVIWTGRRLLKLVLSVKYFLFLSF